MFKICVIGCGAMSHSWIVDEVKNSIADTEPSNGALQNAPFIAFNTSPDCTQRFMCLRRA